MYVEMYKPVNSKCHVIYYSGKWESSNPKYYYEYRE